MKTYNFCLLNAVRITPLSGQTILTVRSNGDFKIADSVPSTAPSERSVTLARTDHGTLSRSPMGMNRTVKITLPARDASENEFHRQLSILFALARLGD